MTVTCTIRYVCGHQEAVRLTGGSVGVLPASYTIAVPFACGGSACRVCDPTPWLLNCGHHRSRLVGFEDGTAVCGACAEQAPSVRPRNDETPRHRAAGRTGMAERQRNDEPVALLGALLAAMPGTDTGDCAYCNATDRPDGPHAADCPWKRARDWAGAGA